MQTKQLTWRFAWDYPLFRVKLVLGLFVMGLIVFYLQDFFLFVQKRNGGIPIHDWVLAALPAHDVSVYIFLILYPASGLFFWRMRKNTELCITALWGYIFLCLVRMLTISLVSLEPPLNLVHMTDPFSIIFYGSNMITRDLFFSGHTATLFLVGLCLENKKEKAIVFCATAILGLLLLIQHVHYTADVLAAPFFSYLFWYMGKTIARI
ncbi:phosphatase PAP2-related protein [Pedobacter hartonius]|uniref:PAP2 superfamily C-terminal n=1 Tax=Pedobacter hartonius TaxID=425514 RepID=A0A1H4BFQ3_9SPHI|nr:phosphatase PAP2-related protein [Pedobacter hartonius]SEA46971.1 PAP2 superfamily C-terminal [Pedobacter hartonius]